MVFILDSKRIINFFTYIIYFSVVNFSELNLILILLSIYAQNLEKLQKKKKTKNRTFLTVIIGKQAKQGYKIFVINTGEHTISQIIL